MPQKEGQKNIAGNRPPRVQIEYDVELYGAERKVRLPFIMGAMAGLSGKPVEPLPSVSKREFLEFDVDNFNDRMRAMKPRAAFTVPNKLAGDGNMAVDLTFQQISDFAPDRVARMIEPLRRLLEAREQLSHLLTYMDGKDNAEQLVAKLLKDPVLLQALASSANPAEGTGPKPEQQQSAEQQD
jgi:type VI secretion system protein ImpB